MREGKDIMSGRSSFQVGGMTSHTQGTNEQKSFYINDRGKLKAAHKRIQQGMIWLTIERTSPRTSWWHMKKPKVPKPWAKCYDPKKTPCTSWLHTKRPESWVKERLWFKEQLSVLPDRTRDWKREPVVVIQKELYVRTDGTRRGQNRKLAVVIQRTMSGRPWLEEQLHVIPDVLPNSTYRRRRTWGDKGQSRVPTDGTQRGRNREPSAVIVKATLRTL